MWLQPASELQIWLRAVHLRADGWGQEAKRAPGTCLDWLQPASEPSKLCAVQPHTGGWPHDAQRTLF